jgi:hypothetical protein
MFSTKAVEKEKPALLAKEVKLKPEKLQIAEESLLGKSHFERLLEL